MTTAALQTLLDSESGRPAVRSGSMTADLLENSITRRAPWLEHHIEVPIDPLDARLRLGPLALGARNWAALQGVVWRPPRPRTLHIDGDVVSTGAIHGHLICAEDRVAVACRALRFGELAGTELAAGLELELQHPQRPWELEVTLTIGAIRILGDVSTSERPGMQAALALAGQHLDLAGVQATVEQGIVVLRLS